MAKFPSTFACPALLIAVFIGFNPPPARASNLLSNPGFEADPPGESQTILAWHLYGPNVYNENDSAIARSGTNYLKVYQSFNGSLNHGGCYQDYISGPGATYSADGS